MLEGRSEWFALMLASVFLLGAGFATTDRNVYTAAGSGIATFENSMDATLYLPGCAPFVFERSLESGWIDSGPPFVCVWEGIAVAVGAGEKLETPFHAPSDTGVYRLRYAYGAGCLPDLPLSEANCQSEGDVHSNTFEVERELCDSADLGCRFRPAAPNFQCEEGQHVGGPASDCTRDPTTGECGYEFLRCPEASRVGKVDVEILPSEPTEVDNIVIRISGTWSDSCAPTRPMLSTSDRSIRIDTSSFGEICQDVLTPWSEMVTVGTLQAGEYEVIVANAMIPAPPELMERVVLTVPEPLAFQLQAAAGMVVALLASGSSRARRRRG